MTSHDERAYAGSEFDALASMARYYGWIVDSFAGYISGDAVEFGAGVGTVSAQIHPQVDRLELVEPSARLAEQLERRFDGNEDVRVLPTTLENYLESHIARSRDTVVLVNVLEHILDDGLAMRSIHDLLRPGGHLLLFVPAMPSLYSEMDRQKGHYRRYTRTGLDRLAKEAGFQILRLRYFDALGIVPWWLVNKLGGSTEFDPRLTRLYDAVGVPFTRTLERIVTPPKGKNLIMVATRLANS